MQEQFAALLASRSTFARISSTSVLPWRRSDVRENDASAMRVELLSAITRFGLARRDRRLR